MAFPSTFSTFNRPTPSDRLNSPSHSALHNTQSSAIGQIEAVIGTDASIIGTIIGDLRNSNSDGGGHVQTANKGGTGQTSYTKGNILVASGPSTLSKVAVGADGTYLSASSVAAAGVVWVPAAGKLFATASVVGLPVGGAASVFSVSIPGSTLGTNNVLRATSFIERGTSSGSVLLTAEYGGGVVTSILIGANTSFVQSTFGKIEYTLFGNGAINSQRGIFQVNLNADRVGPATNASVATVFAHNTASVQSDATQVMSVTWAGSNSTPLVLGTTIEKIS